MHPEGTVDGIVHVPLKEDVLNRETHPLKQRISGVKQNDLRNMY